MDIKLELEDEEPYIEVDQQSTLGCDVPLKVINGSDPHVNTTNHDDADHAFEWRNLKGKIAENTIEIEMHDIDSNGRAKSQQLTSTTTEKISSSESLYPEDNQATMIKVEVNEIDIKEEPLEYERPLTNAIYRCSPNIAPVTGMSEVDPVIKLQRISTYERYFFCNICSDIFPSYLKLIQHTKIHMVIKRTGETNIKHVLDNYMKEPTDYERPVTNTIYRCSQIIRSTPDLNPVIKLQRIPTFERCFVCNICSDIFPSYLKQIQHAKIHMVIKRTGETNITPVLNNYMKEPTDYERPVTNTIYRCSQIIRSTPELNPIIKLQRISTFERCFVCNICYDIFPSSFKQVQHAKFHNKIKHTDKTNIKHVLSNSMKKAIVVGKFYKCELCSYVSLRQSQLKIHKISHSGGKPLKCDKCDYACRQLRSLRSHKLNNCNEKRFKCNECSRKFINSRTLKVHKTTHSGEKPFKCDECDYAGRQYACLKIHKLTHSNEKPFKCLKCNYASSCSGNLKKHKLRHSEEKPFKCVSCNYASSRFACLKTHKLSHSNEKPFKCDQCDFASLYSSSLYVHRLRHSVEKPFKCKKCDYACKRLFELKTHKLNNCNKRSFKCDECNRKFLNSCSLKVHRMIHSGEKPFKCDECDYACRQSASLKIHKLSHSNEKPFMCFECNYASSSSSNLNKHKMKHCKKTVSNVITATTRVDNLLA